MSGEDLGEIRVAVEAEGVDEAADDLEGVGDRMDGDGEGGMLPGGPSGGGQDGSLRQALKGGIFLAAAKILIEAIPGMLEAISAMFEIMRAFLAPLAVMMLRMFQPVLRFMLRLLPLWYDFLQDPSGALQGLAQWLWRSMTRLPGMIWSFVSRLPAMAWTFLSKLPSMIWGLVSALPGMIWTEFSGTVEDIESYLDDLPADIWDYMQRLPSLIGREVASAVDPTSGGGGVLGTGVGPDVGPDVTLGPLGPVGQVPGAPDVTNEISLEGGLDTFVSGVEGAGDVDLFD